MQWTECWSWSISNGAIGGLIVGPMLGWALPMLRIRSQAEERKLEIGRAMPDLLDMLNTFYNWTIPESVCEQWFRANGFRDITLLNRNEPHACGLHMLGVKC